MLASESNAISVVEVLVQRGADLSAVDSQGHDVVHYVKLLGNSEVKSALIAALHRQQVAGKSYAKSLSLSRSHTLSPLCGRDLYCSGFDTKSTLPSGGVLPYILRASFSK